MLFLCEDEMNAPARHHDGEGGLMLEFDHHIQCSFDGRDRPSIPVDETTGKRWKRELQIRPGLLPFNVWQRFPIFRLLGNKGFAHGMIIHQAIEVALSHHVPFLVHFFAVRCGEIDKTLHFIWKCSVPGGHELHVCLNERIVCMRLAQREGDTWPGQVVGHHTARHLVRQANKGVPDVLLLLHRGLSQSTGETLKLRQERKVNHDENCETDKANPKLVASAFSHACSHLKVPLFFILQQSC